MKIKCSAFLVTAFLGRVCPLHDERVKSEEEIQEKNFPEVVETTEGDFVDPPSKLDRVSSDSSTREDNINARILSALYQCEGSNACLDTPSNFEAFLGNNTCIGKKACEWAADDGGFFSAGDNSCIGERACQATTSNGTFVLGDGACVGGHACRLGGNYGDFFAWHGSCLGNRACYWVAPTLSASFLAQEDSCVGQAACRQVATYGSFEAGSRSCLGEKSCYYAAYEHEGSFKVGDDSCVGWQACVGAAEKGLVTIGDGSCIGNSSCTPERARASYVIGDNSCMCDQCCQNLRHNSFVGDNECNSLEDGCFNRTDGYVSPLWSMEPSSKPSSSASPSSKPSVAPSSFPSAKPSTAPSSKPSVAPSSFPSAKPSSAPSSKPSVAPSSFPSAKPSASPSSKPSVAPSSFPSAKPSTAPSSKPSVAPTSSPSSSPSSPPSKLPTSWSLQAFISDIDGSSNTQRKLDETLNKDSSTPSVTGTTTSRSNFREVMGAGQGERNLIDWDEKVQKQLEKATGTGTPIVTYSGASDASRGWLFQSTSRLTQMTITATEALAEGSLELSVMDCSNEKAAVDIGKTPLRFKPKSGKSKTKKFDPPIDISTGTYICIEVIRNGDVTSVGSPNSAVLSLELEDS